MIRGLNYKIEPIKTEGKKVSYRIHALVKRNGKQFPKRELFTGTKNDAIRKAEDLVRELIAKAEEYVAPVPTVCSLKTFKECVDYYAKHHGVKRSDRTYFDRLVQEFGDVELPFVH